ncbi:MAG: ABC transporter substrate-binding protein [Candidatus Taylorbacteria bacterium]|nr:ABC transporter substrate-binding protein [Candidatus Taylorbacteria bacterium]
MVNLKKTSMWVAGIIVVLVIIAAVSASQKPTEIGPIKIGVFTPLTGDAAVYGESLKKGLTLAVEDANKDGVLGRKIELVYEDTHLDNKTAVNVMNKFISIDKFPIIIAAEGSGATTAAVPLADKTKTITIIPVASAASLKDAGDYVFRVIPSDDFRGLQLGKLANHLGYETAAIFYVNDDYGIGIRDLFKSSFTALGGQVVGMESFASGDTDFRSQLTKVKSVNPDVILLAARKEFSVILKQLKTMSIVSKVLAPEILDSDIIKASGSVGEGVVTLGFASTTDYIGFADKYKTAYGATPALYSDFGYDALGIIVAAIRDSGSVDSTKLKNDLYKIEYKGATGLIKFDQNGEVMPKPLITYIVKNGVFVKSE